jgi:hypothetical protein
MMLGNANGRRVGLGLIVAGAVLAAGVRVAASGPRAESIAGWKAYVASAEARRDGFLALDFAGGAEAERQALANGQVVIARMDETAWGDAIDVPGAMVHHWRGAVFVPGITVEALVAALEHGPPPQPDVLRSRVLARTADAMTVYLRLRRARVITVVYDTEHRVTFERVSAGRASSTSVATRITEIDRPGTPQEQAIPAAEDHGFLWRLNSYWRYQAVDGGVVAECESLTLSRAVPFGLGTIAGPIINSTARESMEAALRAVAALGG